MTCYPILEWRSIQVLGCYSYGERSYVDYGEIIVINGRDIVQKRHLLSLHHYFMQPDGIGEFFFMDKGRGNAGKFFEVADKVRLIIKVKGVGHIRESGKASTVDEAQGFVKAFDANIKIGCETNTLGETFFKLALGNAEAVQQMFDCYRSAVFVDEGQTFFH